MPFTAAHAATLYPLRRVGFVYSAFVLGTFAPDFEYFLLLAPRSRFGHEWPGVLVLSLPAAMVGLWLFHAVMKRPAAELLPKGFYLRLKPWLVPFSFGGRRRFIWLLVSAMAGILTHVVWDGITHRNTFITNAAPVLYKRVPMPIGSTVALYNVLQHLSTLLGMSVLAYWVNAWYNATPPKQNPKQSELPAKKRFLVVGLIGAAAFAGGLAHAAIVAGWPGSMRAAGRSAGILIVTTIALCGWLFLAYSVWRHQVPDPFE